MRYFAYWHLNPKDQWVPSRVFTLNDEGQVVGDFNFIDEQGWQLAKKLAEKHPEERRLEEVDKPQADLLSAEINAESLKIASSIYDFRPDAYITIRGAGSSHDWDDAAYVRIKKVLPNKRWLVDLLGINDAARGPLTDILYAKGESGNPERVSEIEDLKLGDEYVLEWSYSMTTSPKGALQILREEGDPGWRHYPDHLLDDDEESFQTR